MPAECLSLGFVNVYFIGEPGEDWVLVDTGCPWHFSTIVRAAERRYGASCRPKAIWLTHGHFDHAGAARALAAYWKVPVYAHPDELPYLTGQCDYPPGDPSASDGWMEVAARFASTKGRDLRPFVQAFPAALLPGWEWVALPGHTHGSVGFWNADARALVAGDALMTLRLNTWKPYSGLAWPPNPFTMDWVAVRKSARYICRLAPLYLGCGHGKPLEGDGFPSFLESFVEESPTPRNGRYAAQPVQLDTDRKPVVAPLPKERSTGLVKAVALGAVALGGLYWLSRKRRF